MAAPNGPAAPTAASAVERAKALYVFSNEKGGMKGRSACSRHNVWEGVY